jgi:hypothetical protein
MDLGLDHISFAVVDAVWSRAFVAKQLGFVVSPTAQDPSNHAVIRLDRWYIELWKPDELRADRDEFPARVNLYFLRSSQFERFVEACRARDLPIVGPSEYHAVDGSIWHDLEFDEPFLGGLLPIVVQPILPIEKRQNHPLPLLGKHPNALHNIRAVYIATDRYQELSDFYARLLEIDGSSWVYDPFFKTEQKTFQLVNGELVICKGRTSGIERTHLGTDREGIIALTFQSEDLAQSRDFFAGSPLKSIDDGSGVTWLLPSDELKLFLGFQS